MSSSTMFCLPTRDDEVSELAAVADARLARRLEFATGRACAHRALTNLGAVWTPIDVGAHRQPIWPRGYVGSISHTDGCCVAAVARSAQVAALGVDLTPARPLPGGVEALVLTERERRAGGDRDNPLCATIIFSAKESVYKAWFAVEGRWLGFEDVEVSLDERGAFVGKFVSQRPVIDGEEVHGFGGRFDIRDGIVATSVTVPNKRDR